MIIANVNTLSRYLSVHNRFNDVNEFIKTYSFSNPGERVYIDGEQLFLIPSHDKAKAKEQAYLEAHNRYIDIQICLEGKETFGWRNRAECNSPKAAFDKEKDIIFYNDNPSFYFDLNPGEMAIFFPEDCHAPMIGEGVIKKLIFKVEL